MNKFFTLVIGSSNDYKPLIPRLIVGLVFLSEGIQKFLFPDLVGVGRFANIGFENAAFLAYFVASFEIICGILLLAGLLTRLASIPLLIIMGTAIVTTKTPKLLNDESPLITPIFQKVEKCIILGFYTLLFWLQVQTQ
jgi:putative oxidoreductase